MDCSLDSARYKRAQDILFGQDLDLATRFAVKSESEKGSILLNKIFEVYQEGGKQVILGFAQTVRETSIAIH